MLSTKKKNARPTKMADIIFNIDSEISNANKLNDIFPIILIITNNVFLHKVLRVNPLSDEANIVNIKKDIRESIRENINA